MALNEGTYRLGPDMGRLLLRTSREGIGRRAGHDLILDVTRWSGEAVVAGEDGSSVTAEAEIDSIEVREGTGGVKPLSDANRAEIKSLMLEKLRAGEHPKIIFRSTAVAGTPAAFTIKGDLTVGGRSGPVELRCESDGDRVRGTCVISQSRYGIKPHTAFFGALKVADEVLVEFDLSV